MTNQNKAFLIGVDGGGSKTVALLSDSDGRLLGLGIGGPSNYHVMGMQAAGSALTQSVRAAFANASVEPCAPRLARKLAQSNP